ncbi:ankyrin repeat-containing domain protein [Hyaloraphidium curvatum]|nr:ankyrin repeat-containing domain protein [Hyaloraphidium curvatum]
MKADKEGYTLAHVAALTGSVSVLRTLAVEDKELLNACDHRGRTPLLLAAQRGQVESIKFLIAEGVNFEHRDNDGLTMLAHATMGNHPSLVRFMLERYPSLVTMTDLQCRAAADMTEQEEVKNAHKVRPFPTEAYVSQCIEKLQGMLKDIKATGAFQGAEFDACDGPFELIKRTLAEARNESHFRDVAKYLGVSVARPMAEFRNVVPVDGKVSTIRAKIEATEAETALEQACENLRDRGRLVVYLTDRLTRNVRVARSMPIKADKDAIAEITKKVEMYRAKIADWEREKEKLANVGKLCTSG